MKPRIEIDTTRKTNGPRNQRYFFRIRAKNGRILCHSETYRSKASVYKAINALRGLIIGTIYESNEELVADLTEGDI
jgi:uncharacterized protein YegP (UPF0339 family)